MRRPGDVQIILGGRAVVYNIPELRPESINLIIKPQKKTLKPAPIIDTCCALQRFLIDATFHFDGAQPRQQQPNNNVLRLQKLPNGVHSCILYICTRIRSTVSDLTSIIETGIDLRCSEAPCLARLSACKTSSLDVLSS